MDRLALDKVAWIHLDTDGRVLTARNHGRDVFYFPGGQRHPGESDVDTLLREIAEELSVAIIPATMRRFGTYELPAPNAAVARMTCYFADHHGTLAAANEIDEMTWMRYADRDRVSPLDQLVFDDLHDAGHVA